MPTKNHVFIPCDEIAFSLIDFFCKILLFVQFCCLLVQVFIPFLYIQMFVFICTEKIAFSLFLFCYTSLSTFNITVNCTTL